MLLEVLLRLELTLLALTTELLPAAPNRELNRTEQGNDGSLTCRAPQNLMFIDKQWNAPLVL